jgi:hypothetical protein
MCVVLCERKSRYEKAEVIRKACKKEGERKKGRPETVHLPGGKQPMEYQLPESISYPSLALSCRVPPGDLTLVTMK